MFAASWLLRTQHSASPGLRGLSGAGIASHTVGRLVRGGMGNSGAGSGLLRQRGRASAAGRSMSISTDVRTSFCARPTLKCCSSCSQAGSQGWHCWSNSSRGSWGGGGGWLDQLWSRDTPGSRDAPESFPGHPSRSGVTAAEQLHYAPIPFNEVQSMAWDSG